MKKSNAKLAFKMRRDGHGRHVFGDWPPPPPNNEQPVLISGTLLEVVVGIPFESEYFQPYRSFPFSVWQSKHSFIFPSQWHLYLNDFMVCDLVLVSIVLCPKQQSINTYINQSIDLAINQYINQSNNLAINQSIKNYINQPIDLAINQ